MIITGASLLGQILTNRASSDLVSAKAARTSPEAAPTAKPGPVSTPAPVTMSLSTLDGLFALQASPRGVAAPADPSMRIAPQVSGADSGPQRTEARTAVDPDLVRAIAAALDSRTSGDAGPAAAGPRSAVTLETSVSYRSSLSDALELAGRAQRSAVDPDGRAAYH